MSFTLTGCVKLAHLLLVELEKGFRNHPTVDVIVKPVDYGSRSSYEISSNLSTDLVVCLVMADGSEELRVRLEVLGEDRDEFFISDPSEISTGLYKVIDFLNCPIQE